MYGAGAWTLWKVGQKYLEKAETWRWGIEKSSWTDRVKKEEGNKVETSNLENVYMCCVRESFI